MSQPAKTLSRRHFLTAAVTAGTTITLVPSHVLGGPGRTGQPLTWDASTRTFTRGKDANTCIRESYHNGWTLG